jgi:hypothetical protein
VAPLSMIAEMIADGRQNDFTLSMAEIGDAIVVALEHRLAKMRADLKAAGIN